MDFPENPLGLVRGSIIISTNQITVDQMGVAVGQKLPVGFDGKYVRSGPYSWDISQLCDEIALGVWEIASQTINLGDPGNEALFARAVERRIPLND